MIVISKYASRIFYLNYYNFLETIEIICLVEIKQVLSCNVFLIWILIGQRDKRDEAVRLAQLSAEKPHFSHCLEWLLFTVFDAEISRFVQSRNHVLS